MWDMDLITSSRTSVLLRNPCTNHYNAAPFSLLCFLDMTLLPLLLLLAAALPPSLLHNYLDFVVRLSIFSEQFRQI